MNENYIPKEEEVLSDSVPEEASVSCEPGMTNADPAESAAPEESIWEDPVCEATSFDVPSVNEADVHEPIVEEPISDEPVTEESTIDGIYFQEPVLEEPIPDDSVIEENAFHEPILEASNPEDSSSDEAVTDIILETLAEQESADAATMVLPPMNETETDELIDELTQEFAPSEPVPAEIIEEKDPLNIPKKERPARKGRPRRKKGDGLFSIPHMLAAAIWLLIILAIGTSLGRMIWVCAADVLAFGRENKEVSISITTDDTMETIAEKLHEAGLINIPELFLLYADLTDVAEEHKITTGTFTLNTIYDYMALVNHMGPRATNRAVVEDVLIPEGFSCRQIFALLEEKGVCKAADLEAYAASGALKDYWFLEGVERGDKYCLEGFLFPDTYDFYENSTPKLALEKMLDGFQYRVTEELYNKLPALNERLTEMMKKNGENEQFIAEHQLDLRDLLTVASMIEEETASNAESYRIASVIYNRLFSWGDTPRYLNIDASIIYALEGKTNLTAEDMAVDSPYNTYTNTGLTPGPISNPGLASIMAALEFEDTSYYYYVLNPATGEHQFSKTYAEHTEWVEKFREAQNNG